MEQKIFQEWSKDDVRAWAEDFIGAAGAQKLFNNDMNGLALSHAQRQDLQACGLNTGLSLQVLAKVAEKLRCKIFHIQPPSLSLLYLYLYQCTPNIPHVCFHMLSALNWLACALLMHNMLLCICTHKHLYL